MNVELGQLGTLLQLKGVLTVITHASFSYNTLGKQYPFNTLTQEQAIELEKQYRQLIEQVENSLAKLKEANP